MSFGGDKGAKVRFRANNVLVFHCPGCGTAHQVWVNGDGSDAHERWSWNKSFDNPTFFPSLLIYGGPHDTRCHSFVIEGKIRFLSDCTHSLANQIVDLPDWDETFPSVALANEE